MGTNIIISESTRLKDKKTILDQYINL